MSNRAKILLSVFTGLLIILNVMSETITNGIISKAYHPYKGIVVVLDSGHGGKDDGARNSGVKEQDLNLKITLKLKEQLEGLGMKVILTREDGNDLASADASNRKKEDMLNRVNIINQKKVDFFISVHMNAYADSTVKGSQIFYDKGDEDSHLFASKIQEQIVKVTNSKMEVKTGDYYILKNSNKIGILLECGFISNAEDRENLSDSAYQEELCKAIKQGMMDFLKEVYE